MHSGSRAWRTAGVLIGLAALVSILVLAVSWSGSPREGVELDSRGKTLASTELDVGMPAAETSTQARSEQPAVVGASIEAAVAPDSSGLPMRFVRGTTSRPIAELTVRLFDLELEPDSVAAQTSSLLAEGRTNAHGLFFAPEHLRGRRFAIEVEAADAVARSTIPNLLDAEAFTANAGPIEVQVFGAWMRIEAVVLDPSGAPKEGATVQFDFESPAFAFSTRDAPSTRVTTDADGLAFLDLVDPASVGGRLRIKAEFQKDLRSETVELAAPLSSRRVELRLATSASAIVRVESAKGAPLAGAMARLERLDAPFTSVGRSTDHEGTASFQPLEPGRYAASVEDPSTHSSTREEFSIASCQMADVRLTLPGSELPLAVAGSVRDAEGKPITWLWVSICVDGREEARLQPDREGRFEYHREACERLRVRMQASFDGPVVDPELVDAAFGASDLAFVLRDAPRMGFTALRVVDAESGLPLGGATAAVFRDSAAERIGGVVSALTGSALSLASNEDGLMFVPSGAQLPRAHLVVEKRGYVRRELDLSDLSLLPEREGRPTLELVRGYLHRWVVLDARTGKPVSGAVATHGIDPFTGLAIEDGSTWLPSAPSDTRGVLELALPQAPARVSIQARGYRPRAVDAGTASQVIGAALLVGDAVLLESEAQR
ncbi:MAG TPA: carboxypeptidase-like regulatory domain-containing protein [Planctomycetota bacterium]|nr:carboxypeptidase-like regulatory domain-containing protein [Planctomycetota bacterium]